MEAQREKLLRKCNGFSACDEHLKNFFNSPLPNGVEHIGGEECNSWICAFHARGAGVFVVIVLDCFLSVIVFQKGGAPC